MTETTLLASIRAEPGNVAHQRAYVNFLLARGRNAEAALRRVPARWTADGPVAAVPARDASPAAAVALAGRVLPAMPVLAADGPGLSVCDMEVVAAEPLFARNRDETAVRFRPATAEVN